MPAQIILSVDRQRISIAPGTSDRLRVTVRNQSNLVDQVALRLEGVAPDWVEVIPAYQQVFRQSFATVEIVVHVPRPPDQAPAGTYPVRVVATAKENAGQEEQVDATLEIQLLGDYRLKVTPPQATAPLEAAYKVRVENGANAPLTLKLAGSDEGERLWYKFEPFELAVAPGSSVESGLTVRARAVTEQTRVIPLVIAATGSFSRVSSPPVAAPIQRAAAEFTQQPVRSLSIYLSGGQGGQFSVVVGNPGPIPVTVSLAAQAREDGLEFEFRPPELTLPAQSEQQATLLVRATHSPAAGEQARYSFQVAAQPAGIKGLVATTAHGAFVQQGPAVETPRPFPWWIVVSVVLLLLLILYVYVATRT